MSRAYRMNVNISGINPRKASAVQLAATGEWPFEDWRKSRNVEKDSVTVELEASGDDSLCGGEDEAEFAARLAQAVWAANGSCCRVYLDATCLEYIPSESYTLDEDEYEKWRKGNPK